MTVQSVLGGVFLVLRVIGCITQAHDLRLVALAACICVLACGTTLNLIAFAQAATRQRAIACLLGASAVFGGGVWSLHFVAMLAFVAGVPIAYGIPMTIASIVVVVMGTSIALAVWLFCPAKTIGVAVGGSLLGLSVSAMHYVGALAMQVPGTLHFNQTDVVASIVTSVVLAIGALARSRSLVSYWRRVEVTGWLALSICGLHFTGMTALSIELGHPVGREGAVWGSEALGVTVGTVSAAILLVGLAATLMEQRLSQRALLELKRMRLLSDMSEEVLIIYRNGLILLINAAGGRLFGLPDDQLVGRKLLDFIVEADHPAVVRRAYQREVDRDHEEISVRTANGRLIPVEFSCSTITYEGKSSTIMAIRDLSDRKRDQARIRHLAHHDALTDLPNRFLLQERISHAMDAAGRSGDLLALLYLDLDHFKPVNDLLGHAAGDALLIQVAARLRAELRSTDTLARVGGDEFVIVVSLDYKERVAILAERLVDTLARPFELEAGRVEIGTSIGIAFYPNDANTEEALTRAADTALYRAKLEKRGTFRFFEPGMDEHLRARQNLERDLRLAIEHGQLQLHYQPSVSCLTGEVEGFEALLRWHHPERGLIPPLDFIPLAEETGLIVRMGQWVLETACAAAAEWQEPHWVAVNVSSIQFQRSDVFADVSTALARSGLAASRLEIELTESVLMEDPKRAAGVLSALRGLGVRLALDDFGTGYSSLSYLHAFKFDKLKIDRSFVARLGEAEDTTIIVRTIIGLAHNLGLLIVAEGIETPEQLTILREFLCDQVQGYLLGRPMQMAASTELLSARARGVFADNCNFSAVVQPEAADFQRRPE